MLIPTGAYDVEESAARAYDLAALKYWGTSTFTNFPVRISQMNLTKLCTILGCMNLRKPECCFLQVSDYEKEIEIMKTVSKEEYLASLRRYLSNPL